MKKFSKIYAIAVAFLALCSCKNEYPEFDDADAFVSFSSSSAYVSEAGNSLSIPVTLASLSGITADVNFTVVDGTAKQGQHFTIEGGTTLHFTKEAPTQNIVIKVNDDDVFGGNVNFTIELDQKSFNTGAANKIKVTIEDDEHPLKFILNDYSCTCADLWGSTQTFNWSIKRDEEDLSKVWIEQFSARYPDMFNHVYGIVSEDHTKIIIPAGQPLMVNSTYDIKLWVGAPDDPELDGEIYDAGMDLVVSIEDNGATLVMTQAWLAYDPAQGAFEAYTAGVTLTKK